MASLTDEAPIPADPLEWRPQVPLASLRRRPTIADPIVEPMWTGRHVLAHFDASISPDAPSLRLIDSDGVDATDAAPDVTAALRPAIRAVEAVIDGYLTDLATRTGAGVHMAMRADVPKLALVTSRPGTVDVISVEEHDRDNLIAFVAVDLLMIDGQSLLDVPLLERKRILDGVIEPVDLVRVSPYTRPPVEAWVISWKSAGFPGATIKAANGRYRPGARAADWTTVTRTSRS